MVITAKPFHLSVVEPASNDRSACDDHNLQVKKGGLQAANVELQELVSIKAPEVSQPSTARILTACAQMGMLWVMNSLHPMAANANLEVLEMKVPIA